MNVNEIKNKRYAAMADTVINALKKRGYEAYYCPDAAAATEKVFSFMEKGSTVAFGGSVTLVQTGITERLKQGEYRVINRGGAKTQEEKDAVMRETFAADTFLSSVNAMTEDGIMINIDGIGNRIAAIAFGPKQVILVVGMNKICGDIASARVRARTFAAPVNAARLSVNTPCAETGTCHDCNSPECICSQIVEMRRNRVNGRIKVVLVGEDLGF